MKLKLFKLQVENQQTYKMRLCPKLTPSCEIIDKILHHQSLLYIVEIICIELIIYHHNNRLVEHFKIEKTRKLIAKKKYWLTLQHNVEAYMKGCKVSLVCKIICHKPYENLQLLPVYMHQ